MDWDGLQFCVLILLKPSINFCVNYRLASSLPAYGSSRFCFFEISKTDPWAPSSNFQPFVNLHSCHLSGLEKAATTNGIQIISDPQWLKSVTLIRKLKITLRISMGCIIRKNLWYRKNNTYLVRKWTKESVSSFIIYLI